MKSLVVIVATFLLSIAGFSQHKTITIQIPDSIANRVLNGYVYSTGYKDSVEVNGVKSINPITKVAWVKKMIIAHLRTTVGNYERQNFFKILSTHVDSLSIEIDSLKIK